MVPFCFFHFILNMHTKLQISYWIPHSEEYTSISLPQGLPKMKNDESWWEFFLHRWYNISTWPKETHTHTEERPCEEPVRRPSASEGELPQKKETCQHLGLELSASWTGRKRNFCCLATWFVIFSYIYVIALALANSYRCQSNSPREQMVTKWALSHRRLWFTHSFIEHGFYLLQKWVSWTRVRIYKILCRQRKI